MSVMAHALPPFQAFLDEHLEPVRAFLRGMVGPNHAEDCLQETFLAALRAYPRAESRNLRAWILTIARRKAIDDHRSRAGRAVPVAEPQELIDRDAGRLGAGLADGALGMSPEHSEIWAAVAELPPGQRAAVVLRFAVDLRYRDVGEAMGTSEEAARRSVHEGLKKLRTSAAKLKEMAR
jgi:RNA polymerase sigma factor (sigma-70 family)